MKKILFVLALVGSFVAAQGAWAANATWNGTSDGTWATAGNWSTSSVPGTGNTATFNNAGAGHTTLDLGGGVTIAGILFDTVNAAAYTIGTGGVGNQTLTLNDAGGITLNGPVVNNQLVNANLTLGTATAGSYGVTNSAASANLTLAGTVQGGPSGVGAAKTLMIAGPGNATISGLIANGGASSVSLAKSGAGTLIVTGTNTYTGNTTAGGGVLRADYGTGVVSTTVLYLQGNGVLETAGTISRTLGTAAGNISFSGSGGFSARGGALGVTLNSAGATLTMGSTASFLGQYSPPLVFGSASADSVVTLNNTLDFTGNPGNSWGGVYVVHNTSIPLVQDKAILNGAFKFTGGNSGNQNGWQKYGNGRLEVTGASVSGGTLNFLISGGVLALTGSGDLSTYRGVWVGGGDFEITGSAAANTAKSIAILGISNGSDLSGNGGVLTSYGGLATVTVVPGSGYGAKLTAASVGRLNGGTALFRGTSLGTATNPSPNVANLIVTDQTQLYLTGDTSNTNMLRKIVPYAIGDNSATGLGTDFVTYITNNVNTGIRLLQASEYANTITDGQTALNNVSITSEQPLTTATTINALRLDAGGIVDGSGTLTLNSGALLALAGNGGISVGTLAFGTKEAILTTLGGLTISSAMTGSGGLTKSGSGGLTLTGSNGITGTNTVNAGTLAAGAANVFGGGLLRVQPGAAADLAGYNQTVAGITGSGVLTNSGAPVTLTINAVSDTTLGVTPTGNIGLLKTGTGTFTAPLASISGSGALAITQGTVQINFSTAIPTITSPNATCGRSITIDNGAGLTYYNNGTPNNNNPYQTAIADPVTIGANGGTLKLDSQAAQNCIGGAKINAITLNGPLTLTNNSAVIGINSAWELGSITLNGSQTITNNSPTVNQFTATLPASISSNNYTLTLASATGAGFWITSATSNSLNIGGLVVNPGTSLTMRNDGITTLDPFTKIAANGGTTTVYGTLTMGGYSFDLTLNPANISFQPGSRLNLTQVYASYNSTWYLTGNLLVSSNGLTDLFCQPYRGYDGGLTTTGTNAITVRNGGRFTTSVIEANTVDTANINLRVYDGGILQGTGNQYGGLIRGSAGSLTLGDGTGTPAAPSVVTIQGNYGANGNTFVLGFAATTTVSGTVKARYANTTAGAANFFNVGWSSGGNTLAALVPLKETSSTEFAPLAASGGLAVVGPASGTVALFSNAVTLSTAGTVGFYNCGGNNVRGTLGLLVVTNGGNFVITNSSGTVQAGNVTVLGGTIGGLGTFMATNNLTLTNNATYQVWLYGSANNQCGLLDVSNALTFASGTTLTVVPTNGFTPSGNQFWYVARSPALSGPPSAPSPPPGYSVEIAGSYLKLTKLDTSGYEPAIANVSPSNVQHNAALLQGNLMSTGQAPVTVSVFWGPADGGSNLASSTWANTNTFTGSPAQGYLSTNVALTADTYYYYRYYATNFYGDFMARPALSFITGDINIQALADAGETGPVTGLFSVARAAALTNEDLTVNYAIGGTASNGVDYTTLTGSVLIARGATNATIPVVAIPDALVEGTEYVTLTLLPGNYVIGTSPTATVAIADYTAKNLTWTDGSGSHKWNGTDLNWTDGAAQRYTDGDNVTFDNSAANRSLSIVGTVQPATVTFQNTPAAPYQVTNGVLAGATALNVTGGGTVKFGLDGFETTTPLAPALAHSGGTLISNSSVVKFSCGSAAPTNAFGSSAVTLNGGRLNLNFSGSLNGGSMWLTNTLAIGALGGILDITPDGVGNSRRPYWYFPGGASLGGTLAVLGDGQNQSVVNTPTFSGVVTLTGDNTISNGTINTGAPITLTALSGTNRTLTLTGTAGFTLATTAAKLNLRNVICNANLSLSDSGGTGADPLPTLRANGGLLTLGTNATLTVLGQGSEGTPQIINPAEIAWQGNGTLDLPVVVGGNGDSYWRFTTNLIVSAASGLTQLNSRPIRGYMTVDAPYALTFGNGGTFNLIIVSGQFYEYLNGNLKLLDGSIVAGVNGSGKQGGMVRGTTGTLTLGDGTGTPANPSVVTIQGNHGTAMDTFNLGYANTASATNTIEKGTVRMRYANTGAGAANYFNVGWSLGGAFNAAIVPFKETSGGTEFAPLAGSGGIQVVGATSGNVATITNLVTVSTAGTVTYRFSGANNLYDVLGPVVVTNGGALAFSTNGIVRASAVTFSDGSTLGVTLVGPGTNDCGQLLLGTGALAFQGQATINVTALPSVTGRGPWYIASASGSLNLPAHVRGGYVATIEGNRIALRMQRGTVFSMQ